ncbi:MAG: fimbrial protein [Parabacteroides sp.]|nr:fimbrial protein [Parabacteroides sp.]
MASCSKDETIDYSQMGPVDAYMSIVAAPVAQTKTELGTNPENYVNTLTAYVFYKEGALAGVKHLTYATAADYLKNETKGLIGIDHVVVKVTPTSDGKSSTDELVAVLVANADQVNIPNLAGLKAATITKDIKEYAYASVKDKKAYLPMVGADISFSGVVPNVITDENGKTYTENWLDPTTSGQASIKKVEKTDSDPSELPATVNPVTLTRLVARVQVEKINVSFNPTYPGAKFELQNLSVVNVSSKANIVTGVAPYVKGYESSGYKYEADNVKSWIDPTSTSSWETYKAILGKGYTGVTLDSESDQAYPDTKEWADGASDKFYVYIFGNPVVGDPNESPKIYQTALLISGKFYKNAADTKGEVKNFRVFLQDIDNNGPIMVIPNNVYKLKVQITGEGSPNEDKILLNAHVAATIEVAPWNVIIQSEDDSN